MFKPRHLITLGVTFAMLFGLVGSFDYQDAQASHALYCEMIQEGTWPAYDNSIDCVNEYTEKQQKKTILQAVLILQNETQAKGKAQGKPKDANHEKDYYLLRFL